MPINFKIMQFALSQIIYWDFNIFRSSWDHPQSVNTKQVHKNTNKLKNQILIQNITYLFTFHYIYLQNFSINFQDTGN